MRIEYICEKCGTRYTSEQEAKGCEYSHSTPDSYSLSYKLHGQYPNEVRFKFGDKVIAYAIQ